ncbi:MAG: type II toxin-antitoxin system RelE/ParE family toxin [Ancrocorticia sp.]|uniref:type II toxin-antitoxin system RelE/ParE family toxin n=1 Tax=Ancrocorticia sp. TaxID=2593684 RepID=UPI003F8E6951
MIAAIEVLREQEPQLGRPLVDTLIGSRHKNMKELRPGSSGRSELRILFAFDPE